ncbi:hypothetical protein ACFQ14_07650 [Pseudahrensia aquimaris]|uniref:Cell division protein FtsL n=1 Tax=Pseudahrensia aquimaris TaxID=744461 RepID=A0ABW3FCW0_9HYPH
MIRILDAVLVAAVIGGAVWTFQIKHSAEQSAKRIALLTRQIEAEERKITLLRADWAIMTSPERLENVAKAFESQLGLAELRSDQIASLDELPPLRPDPKEKILQALEEGDDTTLTGTVEMRALERVPTPTLRSRP